MPPPGWKNRAPSIERDKIPFTMQVADNSKATDVLSGQRAMAAAGAQQEFIAANLLQASALNCALILRAGAPPQYNKRRGSKSGVNLSKTSNQSLFKGALTAEERFSRLEENNNYRPHHEKDKAHLSLPPSHPEYQHTMPLDINMHDILRETGPNGDLQILGFNKDTGILRLAYKEGHGPKKDDFKGQFVINLNTGDKSPQFYSRAWDKPDQSAGWNAEKKIINKPEHLSEIPDKLYEQVFNQSFKVNYTEQQTPDISNAEIKKATVFANRPRDAVDFKKSMGSKHPYYQEIKDYNSLPQILRKLGSMEDGEAVILEVYNKSGSIVAGDWDGLALSHPPGLDKNYTKTFNTFAVGREGLRNKADLLTYADEYLDKLKADVALKIAAQEPLSNFDLKIQSLSSITEIVSDFALARAGCITAHEFVFQQVLNHAYRDEKNAHYGDKYDINATQNVFNDLLQENNSGKLLTTETIKEKLQGQLKLPQVALARLASHIESHLNAALIQGKSDYVLPHLDYDMNVHDLYQHGFDMRNPYGSNMEGPWLLVAADGGVLYGTKQEQLIEVLLTGDFLKENPIDVNHGAMMNKGWNRVIEKQIELKQNVPPETMEKYVAYNREVNAVTLVEKQKSMKELLAAGRETQKVARPDEPELNERRHLAMP